ncbi:putative NAD-dependent epimerase/dehydratase family protein [Flavobacteriaceae bacterium MAR_2009_75]|nr:putative NAD-dependent epimerase/dehydratase family protein [Flavobacteriaceae bacterium MAR_2009_75]
MKESIDGKALVYCEGAFNTPNGKTAHGLVRFTERYEIVGVLDRKYKGGDAGEVLDGKPNGIPIFENLEAAIDALEPNGNMPKSLVVGLAPDGGRLPNEATATIKKALQMGWNVDSGLHDFLSNDAVMVQIAAENNCCIRDVRKTPDRDKLHFFTGEIEKVDCLKLAVLGTDSALGKRTTSWLLVHGFRDAGLKSEMIGTGQTAWMQGAKYSMVMDSCINDFVSGEIEHAVVSAYNNEKPDVIVIEGQGSLMNPAYPGGFEILAAGRPDYVILQHAPKREEYDGFPGYKLHSLPEQIIAIEVISGKKVIAITVNHENMQEDEILEACKQITLETKLPAFDVLKYGVEDLIHLLKEKIK